MAGNIYTGISTPSLGANLGNALGQGILGGIQNVIDLRARKIQQQEIAKAFKDLGFTESEAQGISKLDPALQQVYLRQKKTTSPTFDQSGLAALQNIGVDPALAQFGPNVLGAAIKEKLKPNTASGIKAVIPGISDQEAQVVANLPPSLQSAYFRYISQSPPSFGQAALNPSGLETLQNIGLGIPQQVAPVEQIIPGTQQMGLQNLLSMQAPAARETVVQELEHPAIQISQPAKTVAQQAQESRTKAYANKQVTELVKPYTKEFQKIRERAETSKKNINTYNQIIKLAESDKLRSGGGYQLLSKLGFQDFFTNPETQVARKLMSRLVQGASAAFNTGRLTNLDVQKYAESLPSLWNTNEGLIAIAKNNILEEQANVAKNEARKQAIQEARDTILKTGTLPFDISDRINELEEPVLQRLTQEAFQNIGGSTSQTTAPIPQTAVPEAQSALPQLQQAAPQPAAQPGLLENPLIRGAARTGSRALESLAGLGGDVLGGTLGLANYASGGAIPTYQTIQNALEERGIPHLPTSQQLRQVVTKGLTGEALEPQGGVEEFVDDVVSDISTLALPIKGKIPLKAAAAKALGGNFASWATREIGGGPLAQAGAKLGVMTLASLPGARKALTNNMKDSYKAAEDIASGVKEDAKGLSSKVNSLLRQTSKGASTPEKEVAKKFLLDVDEKIGVGNKIALDEVTQLKRDVNKILYDPSTKKETAHLLNPITTEFDDLIKEYAKKSPEFAENFYKAEDIWRGLNLQSKATKYLNKYVDLDKYPLAKYLLLGGSAYLGGAKGLAAVGGALGVREASKAIDLLRRSYEARKYYGNTLQAALEQSAPAALREAKKLDAVAKKEI